MKASEENTNQTPIEDLKKQALEHYEEAANAIHCHNSFVVKCIKEYAAQSGVTRENVKSIIHWTHDALHNGKITGSDNEIANNCMKELSIASSLVPETTLAMSQKELKDNETKSAEWRRDHLGKNTIPEQTVERKTAEEFFKSRLQKPDKYGYYKIPSDLLHEYMEASDGLLREFASIVRIIEYLK